VARSARVDHTGVLSIFTPGELFRRGLGGALVVGDVTAWVIVAYELALHG
jgi:hypothetical protein